MAPRVFSVLILLPTVAAVAHAEARLAPIFQSGMVLQQGNDTRLFGTASPGERVTVTVGPAKASGKAGADGRFVLKIRTPKAGGPYTVDVQGESGTPQRLSDVLVGEVWFCSGQSNMEWEANWFNGRRFEIGEADFPNIRLFKHAKRIAVTPQSDAQGTWERSNAVNTRAFSLVGFLFGRKLHRDLNVPIGLISSAWGGTPAESWIDLASLDAKPLLAPLAQKYRATASGSGDAIADYRKRVDAYNERVFGNGTDRPAWAAANAPEPSEWKEVVLPGAFETIVGRELDGVTWVRRSFEVQPDWAGKDLVLELGPIDDYDTTYVNGERVGFTGPETANAHATPRKYTIPGRLVKSGTNVVAVRVIDTGGGGGPTGPVMRFGDGTLWQTLNGRWQMRVEKDFAQSGDVATYRAPDAPLGLDNPWLPTSLFNGMVTSVAPYSVKGAIWYQGESNVGRANEYSVLFPDMIQSWRRVWDNPKMAFHFVQLASFGPEGNSTTESGWAELREAQTAALKLPGVGMAVAIDAGEAADIHPIRKDIVADRLAFAALAKTYGKRVPFEGPTPRSFRAVGNELRIRMANGKGLKTLDGRPIRGFAVAGEDGKFYVAEARIEGEEVVLKSANVAHPTAVRYAWADYIPANLANGAGLAAPPFRSKAR
ncbi:MAG: sialate O-acetylesterase [Fimbriimonas sp.]